jgi:hypothetical protein
MRAEIAAGALGAVVGAKNGLPGLHVLQEWQRRRTDHSVD